MARHPEWFSRLDSIEETVEHQVVAEWYGRQEVAAAFGVSNRDSIRLLHQFGAARQAGLEVSAYQAFLRQREQVASHVEAARRESAPGLRVSRRNGWARARLEDLLPFAYLAACTRLSEHPAALKSCMTMGRI